MRTYGSSPLYNYIDLIFRCKRMFIVAMIIGTVIISAFIAMRGTAYQADLLIQLGGDPAGLEMLAGREKRSATQAVKRKSARLAFWLKAEDSFIPSVLKDAGMSNGLSEEATVALVEKVSKGLAKPRVVNESYMDIAMTWPKPDELIRFLNALYGRFASKTVDYESLAFTNRRLALQAQFDLADKDANEKAIARIKFLRAHFDANPAFQTRLISRLDATTQGLNEIDYNIGEAQGKLAGVNQQLAKTPPKITQEPPKKATAAVDPVKELQDEQDDLNKKRDAALKRYTPTHPKIKDFDQQIKAKGDEIEAAKKKADEDLKNQKKANTFDNPLYLSLQGQKAGYENFIKGLTHRRELVEKQLAKNRHSLEEEPILEDQFVNINDQYNLSNRYRRRVQAQLQAAKSNEARDRLLETKEISRFADPKAQKQDSSGKTALLFFLGPILGAIVAMGFSLLAETMDHTVRTPVEVEKYLGKPVLAVIPRMQPTREKRKRLARKPKPSVTS